MLISPISINTNSVANYRKSYYPYCPSIAFKGQLEDDFFIAAENNDINNQLRILSSIDFDIKVTDKINNNNFLHITLINGDNQIIKKALALLLNKKKEDRLAVMLHKNKQGQSPLDYAKDETVKLKLKNLVGIELPIETPQIKPTEKRQLNELTESEHIHNTSDTIGFFEDNSNLPTKNDVKLNTNTDVITKSFDLVVGHNKAKDKLSKLIMEPYKNNKFIPINGFLLYGPSGIGKTYLAKSLFKELKLDFNPVSSIAELEKIMEEAKETFKKQQKQTLVFIDNIDAFLPKMDNYRDNTRTSRLMQLIENSSNNGVILIAATNKIFSIESTAITSNRFDEHIELLPLDIDDRKELIKLYLNNRNSLNLSDENISKIVTLSLLFSPATLVSIINKVLFLNKTANYNDVISAITNYAKEQKIDLSERGKTSCYDTFIQREILKDYDPKSLDEVKGMESAKQTLRNSVIASFDPKKQQEYKDNKINIPNGILLYGPPGCGKTYIVKAVAAQADLPLYQIKLSDFGSKYANETSNRLKQAFDQLRTKYKNTNEASILFFDECDSFFRKIGDNDNYRTDEINTLKEEMNNAGRDGIIVIAATNEIQNLNDAIVRDGRFDDKIYIDLPDKEARFGLIEFSLEGRIKTKELVKNIQALQELTDITDGLSSVTITSIINKVVKIAVDSNISQVPLEQLINAFNEKKQETLDIIKQGVPT